MYLKNYLISYTLCFAIVNSYLMWYVEAIYTKMWVVSILYQWMHTCEFVILTKRMDVRCNIHMSIYVHALIVHTCDLQVHTYIHTYIHTYMLCRH